MLVRVLLQTSLVLWLARQTLQGGVKPQSVSWGRALPARGVGAGVKPGVTGALGALGSRYGTRAATTGTGRYPGAQLGVGGYRALGLGGRAAGFGAQGPYGASLGTGVGLGAGLTDGRTLGLGQGGKRVYGAGLGAVPGYGAVAGIGYPGARPGVSAADLGGPEMANLGQTVQDLKSEKNRALGPSYGIDTTLEPEKSSMRRTNVLGATVPETGLRPTVLQPGREVKSLDPVVKSSSLGPVTPLDEQSKRLAVSQAQAGERHEPMVSERRGTGSLGAILVTGGVRQNLPLNEDNIGSLGSASSLIQRPRDYDSSRKQNQWAKNCGSTSDLSGVLKINRHELLGSETQRLLPQPHVGEDSKLLRGATPQAREERTDGLSSSQTQDVRGSIFPLPQGPATRNYSPAAADWQGAKDLVAKDKNGPTIRGNVAVETRSHAALNLQVQGQRSYAPVIPGASETQSLGMASVRGQEGKDLTADVQKAKHLPLDESEVSMSKALTFPGQTGRNTQVTSYGGGAGNYLGAGGYGAGLGQGAYLGGTAGKFGGTAPLGQGAYPQGYGEGATGYLGAVGGNGFSEDPGAKALSTGYGNGYSDGYGAGLGNPAELADGAENKAGKHKALSTGAYPGQVQGAYGALGAGLDSTGGRYGGGAAQVPYGHAPVIPTGLEGAGAGYGTQRTGYGAQIGATRDALGEQAGKYGGVNEAFGNGYKG